MLFSIGSVIHGSGGLFFNSVLIVLAETFKDDRIGILSPRTSFDDYFRNTARTLQFISNKLIHARIGRTLFQLCHDSISRNLQKSNQELNTAVFFNQVCTARIGRTEFRFCHDCAIRNLKRRNQELRCFFQSDLSCTDREDRVPTLSWLCYQKPQKKKSGTQLLFFNRI